MPVNDTKKQRNTQASSFDEANKYVKKPDPNRRLSIKNNYYKASKRQHSQESRESRRNAEKVVMTEKKSPIPIYRKVSTGDEAEPI